MNRTTRTLLCLALTLTLSLGTGIALAQDATPVPVLDVEWNLSKLAGEDVSDAGITATFHSEGTIVSGFGGCNTYTAGWSSDGVALEIEQILATLKLCEPEVSDRERTYFKTLQAATGWTLDGSVVTITSADGSTLVFGGDAAESPIAGSWSLTSIDGDRVPAGITATAVFGPDHALSGKGGCNDFRGQYTTDGTSLSISDLLASLMFCPDASEFESRYLSALGQASGWSVDGGSLTITGAAELVYQGGDASGTSFAGQDWLLVAQDGVEVDPTLGISAAFFEDGTVSGFGGCNQYHSTWSADGATVAIGDIGSTHMFCEPPANAAEAAFLAAMPTASTFELSGTDLTITTTSGGSLDFQPSGNRSAPVPSPVTTPAATPVGTPVPSPVTTPAATPVGTPVPSPVTTPAATPVGTPVPSPVTTPAATPVGTPVPSPVTTPAATPVGTPVPSPVTTPAATPVGTPVPSPVTTPAATPVGTPVPTPGGTFGASAVPSPGSSAALTDQIVGAWHMTRYSGQLVPTSVLDISITFAADGTFTGNGGCNDFSGTWTLEGTELALNDFLPSTGAICDQMTKSFEDGFIGLVPLLDTATITNGTLSIGYSLAPETAAFSFERAD